MTQPFTYHIFTYLLYIHIFISSYTHRQLDVRFKLILSKEDRCSHIIAWKCWFNWLAVFVFSLLDFTPCTNLPWLARLGLDSADFVNSIPSYLRISVLTDWGGSFSVTYHISIPITFWSTQIDYNSIVNLTLQSMVFQTDQGGRWKRSGQVRTWLWAEKFVCLFTPDCLPFAPIQAILAILILLVLMAILKIMCNIVLWQWGTGTFRTLD